MNSDKAYSVILSSIAGFRQYAATVKGRAPGVRPDTSAARDEEISGTIVFPNAIVSGLMTAAADQMDGWVHMAEARDESPAQLHVLADYTLFRPIIEALTQVIWILDGDDSRSRIDRAVELARIELRHGQSLTERLRRAGEPDERVEESMSALERHIRRALERLHYTQEQIDEKLDPRSRTLDPSAITRKIGRVFPGPSLELNRYWGITSAHAHGQLITTLSFSVSEGAEAEGGGYLHEPDEVVIAEILGLIRRLIDTANGLLNRRGYFLHS